MTLVKFTPMRDLMVTPNRLNRMFDSFFESDLWREAAQEQAHWSPRIDVEETQDAIMLRADLPGMKKEDIEISVEDQRLTLRGQRRSESEEGARKFRRVERRFGSFCRTYTLPTTVLSNKIEAAYKNGELEIVLPKAEEVKSRQIQIR